MQHLTCVVEVSIREAVHAALACVVEVSISMHYATLTCVVEVSIREAVHATLTCVVEMIIGEAVHAAPYLCS